MSLGDRRLNATIEPEGRTVISHRYKCVYVHVPKAGGQSIETVFVALHGLPWDTRAPLLLRPCSDRRFGPRFLAHLTAREYVSCGHLSEADYQEYFTFAAVRNPWDRVLSTYRYLNPEGISFSDWVRTTLVDKIEHGHFFFKSQAEYVTDADGAVMVDQVLRLEDFPHAFDTVRERLGLGGSGLPKVNVSKKHAGLTADVAYDGDTETVVGQLYAADVALFGYQPPSSRP
jgi:hypothetical protein